MKISRRHLVLGAALLGAVPAAGACSGASSGGVVPSQDSGPAPCYFGCGDAAPRADAPGPGVDAGDGAVTLGDAPAAGDAEAGPLADGSMQGEAGPPVGAQCKPGAFYKNDTAVASIAAAGFDRFGSVSGDELTVAWATSAGAVFVADRATSTDAFGAPVQLATGAMPASAGDRPALGPSGVSLVIVASGGASLVGFSRASRSAAWAATSQNEMAQLAGMVQPGNMGQFSEPVLGGDGVSLFFMFSTSGNAPQIVESKWDGVAGDWLPANGFTNPELSTSAADSRRRPTGASEDGRTLFFFDEVTGQERAAWRNTPTSPLTFFETVATPTEASPNRFCTAVYFQGEGAVAAGLYEGQ